VAITVTCAQCQHTLRVKDEVAGKRGRCPQCQAIVQIPAVAESAVTPAPLARDSQPGRTAQPGATSQHSATMQSGAAAHSSQPLPAPPSFRPSSTSPIAPVTTGQPAAGQPLTAQPTAARRAVQPRTPAPPTIDRRQQILSGFRGEVPRVRTSLLYRLGIVVTALFMILLPIVYLAIIGLACWGMWWHVTTNHVILTMVRGRAAIFAFMLYLAPVIVGGTMILFMIKPLFARPAKESRRRSVTPHSDPLLFEFVARICELVKAPMPKRIDIDCEINASASFRRGWLSLLLGGDMVLTIGMPLAAGLSLRQLAGVLAHEFGHFSQGVGMRLTYVIRSINMWFIRVVYERDSWDEWLESATDGLDIRIGWIILVARLAVWITRKILWVLMFAGHVVAGFMLRQMEFDADKYEARLAGSDTFETTCRQLRTLGLAWYGAQNDIGQYYSEGRLVDNLPRLVVSNVGQLPDEAHKFIDEQIAKTETSWFDSHPADKDRIAAARAEQSAGVFVSDQPATALFENFDAAAKNVTWDYYCAAFGRTIDPKTLHPTEDLLARQGQDKQADDALGRFYAGTFSPLRPLRLPVIPAGGTQSPTLWQEELQTARSTMAASAAGYQAALESYDDADTRQLRARQLRSLAMSNVRPNREQFPQMNGSAGDASNRRDRALAEQGKLATVLEPFEDAAGKRLRGALMLVRDQNLWRRLPAAETLSREAAKLWPLVSLVNNQHASMFELRNTNGVFAALLSHIEGNQNNEALIREILEYSDRVRRMTAELRDHFARIEYPLDHAGGPIPVSRYLVKIIPPAEEVGAVFQTAEDVLSSLVSLHARCVGRLCLMAEAIEADLGYEPLASVKPREKKVTAAG
jgi:Zn-dependent protease with chaperone function